MQLLCGTKLPASVSRPLLANPLPTHSRPTHPHTAELLSLPQLVNSLETAANYEILEILQTHLIRISLSCISLFCRHTPPFTCFLPFIIHKKMPSATLASSPSLTIHPLSPAQSRKSLIGAEVVVNPDVPNIITPKSLCGEDIALLRQALYDYSVLVIKRQNGIDPASLPKLAAIWDEKIIDMHSGGLKAVTNPKNILSINGAARTPSCESVTIIGNGRFDGYMGIEKLELVHVVSSLGIPTLCEV